MSRKAVIGILAGAMLLSGMLVGVAFGGGGGITQPEVIELKVSGSDVGFFPIKNKEGKRAIIAVTKESLDDADGNAVGTHRWNCAGWVCNDVIRLKAGPHTDRGTVTVAGNFRGFNGESWAVTGGTGAYVNVRGYMTLTHHGGDLLQTLYLIP